MQTWQTDITISPWPHRWAVLLVCATFPLICVGAQVTTEDAGMAVYDWPTTFGKSPLIYTLSSWVKAPWEVFIEHGHRMLGWIAGLATIALCVSSWRSEHRVWMRALGWVALLLVVSQGVLGGMRVRFDNTELAKIHGCVGPLFFAFSVALAVFTSYWWHETPVRQRIAGGEVLMVTAVMTTVLAYLQILLGAQLRHIAPDTQAGSFSEVTRWHLGVAIALAFFTGVVFLMVWVRYRWQKAMLGPASTLLLLVLLQVLLGGCTWVVKYGWPYPLSEWSFAAGWTNTAGGMAQAVIVTAHVATGSLILVTSLMLSLRLLRLLRQNKIVQLPVIGSSLGVVR